MAAGIWGRLRYWRNLPRLHEVSFFGGKKTNRAIRELEQQITNLRVEQEQREREIKALEEREKSHLNRIARLDEREERQAAYIRQLKKSRHYAWARLKSNAPEKEKVNVAEYRTLRARDIRFDEQFDLDTDDYVEVDELDIDEKRHAVRYVPTYVDLFLGLEPFFPKNIEQFVFIDIGAGKGRVVLLASHFPFKEIIGIEFVPKLYRIMEKNINKYIRADQRCTKIKAILLNALEYELPKENIVFYMFNPMKYDAETLPVLVDRILQSYRESPREILVLFVNPNGANRAKELFENSGIFTVELHDAPELSHNRDRSESREISPLPLLVCRTREQQSMLRSGGAATGLKGATTTEPASIEDIPDEDIPELPLRFDRAEYENASPEERAEFEHNHRQLKESGYVGDGARATAPCFVIDFAQFKDFSDYVAQCKKVNRGGIEDVRKAGRRGYYSRFFNRRNHLGDILAIAESGPERQGRPLSEGFFLTVDEQGGYPAAIEPECVPTGAVGWERNFGVFRSSPGHRQGHLVVDEELVAYAHLRRYANAIWLNRFIGHRVHNANGTVHKMHFDLIERIFAGRALTEAADASVDRSLRGVRYLASSGYAYHLRDRWPGPGGLLRWKLRVLFRPGLFRYDDDQHLP